MNVAWNRFDSFSNFGTKSFHHASDISSICGYRYPRRHFTARCVYMSDARSSHTPPSSIACTEPEKSLRSSHPKRKKKAIPNDYVVRSSALLWHLIFSTLWDFREYYSSPSVGHSLNIYQTLFFSVRSFVPSFGLIWWMFTFRMEIFVRLPWHDVRARNLPRHLNGLIHRCAPLHLAEFNAPWRHQPPIFW